MTHSLVEAIKAARGRAIARAGQGRKAIEYGPPQRARANYGRAIRSLWSTDQAIERDFKQSVLVYRAVMGLRSRRRPAAERGRRTSPTRCRGC
jgi:hypothetical protein